MVFRLSPEAAARLRANLAAGKTSEMLAVELVERTTIESCKLTIPSDVRPTFEKERGQTVKEVFGRFSSEHVLPKSLEKIRSGEYCLTPTLAKEIGAKADGTFGQAEWAALLFIRQCLRSRDKLVIAWASVAIRQADLQLDLTPDEMMNMSFDGIKRKLVAPPEVEDEQQQQEKSWGAQGQTRKPGSHGESRHR